jgi:hypothetical protein
VVYLPSMKSAAESLERGARRWAEKTDAAARRFVSNGCTHEQIALGLASIPGGAYSVTKRGGRALNLLLPGDLCELLGLKAGDRVAYWVTEQGAVELRPVSLEDLPEFARAAAARADQMLAAKRPPPLLKHFEKLCERCSRPYCARRAGQRFCPTCGLLRARESDRRHWHRRGKLTPSYARKLKGRRGAEGELATPQAEGNADGATHDALVRG